MTIKNNSELNGLQRLGNSIEEEKLNLVTNSSNRVRRNIGGEKTQWENGMTLKEYICTPNVIT